MKATNSHSKRKALFTFKKQLVHIGSNKSGTGNITTTTTTTGVTSTSLFC